MSQIFIDENLSPSISATLKGQGYKLRMIKKETLDIDIIVEAWKKGGIVFTNNVKDFKQMGVIHVKATQVQKDYSECTKFC